MCHRDPMQRPPGRHLRLAERAAFASGARAVEWKNGGSHLLMLITLPDGRTVKHTVAHRLASFEAHIANWIKQRMRQEMRRERGQS